MTNNQRARNPFEKAFHGVLLAAILAAAPCLAQSGATRETSRKAEPDAGGGQGESRPVLTRHDVIVVTATRTETKALELPVSVAIAGREDVEQIQFNNPNVGEIVRDLPGVSVGHGNRNIPPWIHLRGTGYFIGRTLYMVDELPLAEPMVSIAVHPSNLAATEVVLGPSSSLYGANASGGVLNMRSANGRQLRGLSAGVATRPSGHGARRSVGASHWATGMCCSPTARTNRAATATRIWRRGSTYSATGTRRI
ncbi:MAG: TonB-dependent receptor plug domain-containing protein [Bryobacteraceae bacterium]|nr:TonB-dependent receptor plug domain-containing protein [Bryobacteraceae bacterium]